PAGGCGTARPSRAARTSTSRPASTSTTPSPASPGSSASTRRWRSPCSCAARWRRWPPAPSRGARSRARTAARGSSCKPPTWRSCSATRSPWAKTARWWPRSRPFPNTGRWPSASSTPTPRRPHERRPRAPPPPPPRRPLRLQEPGRERGRAGPHPGHHPRTAPQGARPLAHGRPPALPAGRLHRHLRGGRPRLRGPGPAPGQAAPADRQRGGGVGRRGGDAPPQRGGRPPHRAAQAGEGAPGALPRPLPGDGPADRRGPPRLRGTGGPPPGDLPAPGGGVRILHARPQRHRAPGRPPARAPPPDPVVPEGARREARRGARLPPRPLPGPGGHPAHLRPHPHHGSLHAGAGDRARRGHRPLRRLRRPLPAGALRRSGAERGRGGGGAPGLRGEPPLAGAVGAVVRRGSHGDRAGVGAPRRCGRRESLATVGPSMSFQLTIAEGKEAGKEFVFDQSSVVIGRTADCDVILYDPGVSRKHARIFSQGKAYYVEDMGSSNGTKVNGSVVKKKQLSDGDAVALGPVVFHFTSKVIEDMDTDPRS